MKKRYPPVPKKRKRTAIEAPTELKNLSDLEFKKVFIENNESCLEKTRLDEEEFLMWKELMARIMKNKTFVTANYSPKDFLESGTWAYHGHPPTDGNFSMGSLNLLPCGYFNKDKAYGDPRFQRYWLNAFFGQDGSIKLSIAGFIPYDRKVSPIRWGKKARSKNVRVFGPGEGHSIQALTRDSPVEAKNQAYNCLYHAVRINPDDEGNFWKGLRLEMAGVMENYLDNRSRDLDNIKYYDKCMQSEEGRDRLGFYEGVANSIGRKLKDTLADVADSIV